MQTASFNPADYCFRWTPPPEGQDFGWYEWNEHLAHKEAKRERDAMERLHVDAGRKVRKGTIRNQLITRGGIGTGRFNVEATAKIYTLAYAA